MQWGLHKLMQVHILLIFAVDGLWIIITDWWTQRSVRFLELYSNQPLGEEWKVGFYFWIKCWSVYPRFDQPANLEICICGENRACTVQINGEKLAFVCIGAPPPSHLGLAQAHLEAFVVAGWCFCSCFCPSWACAVFSFHNSVSLSLHRWVGICAAVMFPFQVWTANVYTVFMLNGSYCFWEINRNTKT